MTIRRQRREDPAYLTAMREAKELFDAEMAKNSMKGRGRPKTVVAAAPAAAEVEIDHEVVDEIADLSAADTDAADAADTAGEADIEDVDIEEVALPRATKRAAKTAGASRGNGKAAKSAAKGSAKVPVRAVKKPAPKKKAASAKKTTRKR